MQLSIQLGGLLVAALTAIAGGVPASVRADIPRDILDDVRGEDERKRRSAVTKLADIGTPEAWELVAERLADEEPEVADRAQIELARIEGEEALEVLHGKLALRSKSDLVRERAGEALGRAERQVECEELLRTLGDKEPAVRRMALWSVERLAEAARLGDEDRDDVAKLVDKAAKGDRDGAARGAALIALAALGDGRAPERIEAALGDRDRAVRCGALMALGVLGEAGGAERIVDGLGAEPHRALRIAAVRGLEAQADRSALLALAALLEAESEIRIQQIVVAALRGLTGEGIGRNARAWQGFAQGLPEDWQPQRSPSAIEAGDTAARLAGLPILSDSLTVLIDMSGSMWTDRGDGRTLKDLVEVELNRFFELLPDGARFNLIPYATEPQAWQKKLVPASKKNRRAALDWFEKSRLRGRGNVWDAIELALEDEDVDTLIVLTDGAPTGGPHWDMRLIPDLLIERNRFRHVAFDVILTDPRSSLEKRWADLAGRSGGICTRVEFTGE